MTGNIVSQVPIVIHEIPLLRFLLKIAEAYPNADRNLNLEAFNNKVLNQEMEDKWMNSNDFVEEKQAIGRASLIKLFDVFRMHLSGRYTLSQH